MRRWQLLLLVVVMVLGASGGTAFVSGCAARQDTAAIRAAESDRSFVRPWAQEKSLTDRIGEVGVVLLAVALMAGSIALPILLL